MLQLSVDKFLREAVSLTDQDSHTHISVSVGQPGIGETHSLSQ
jgi:hypothetical protein